MHRPASLAGMGSLAMPAVAHVAKSDIDRTSLQNWCALAHFLSDSMVP